MVADGVVTVLGLGLIGGSVLRALARAGWTPRGYDADPATRAAARTADTGARVYDEMSAAVHGADVLLLAVPVPAVAGVLDRLAGHPGLVTDVTSVKLPVLRATRRLSPATRYVGGHPMAGRERAGFDAADGTLFDDRPWALCLEEDTDPADWLRVAALVTRLGARVVPVTAAEHDDAVARISHLPHLVAAAVAAAADTPLAAGLAAGSFRDVTRVAGGPPSLSAAICGGNAEPVTAVLDELLSDLTAARALLAGPAPIDRLAGWFERGHAVRSGWPPAPGAAPRLTFDRDRLLALGRAGGWLTAVTPATATAPVTLRACCPASSDAATAPRG